MKALPKDKLNPIYINIYITDNIYIYIYVYIYTRPTQNLALAWQSQTKKKFFF